MDCAQDDLNDTQTDYYSQDLGFRTEKMFEESYVAEVSRSRKAHKVPCTTPNVRDHRCVMDSLGAHDASCLHAWRNVEPINL